MFTSSRSLSGGSQVKLYLVRHGEAVSKDEDARRPLSVAGAETVAHVGAFLSGERLRGVGVVHHSTKLRARQTAEILCEAAGLRVACTEVAGLEPLAELEDSIAALNRVGDGDVMFVGHLPHLNRLASRLVADAAELEAFRFPPCGVLCLQRTEGAAGRWEVAWFLVPELVDGARRGDS